MNHVSKPAITINPSNRLGLEYDSEAARMPAPVTPIVDVHTHINGEKAARIYQRAARLYGIGLTYSMTQLEQVPAMKAIFGDAMRFIAVPDWSATDKKHAMGAGFLEGIRGFHAQGCRICKFWAAPSGIEIAMKFGEP
jgi:hypothetical protein